MARLPYTNFHDINLDWLIKRVMPAYTPDNPPPYPVKSVNGKTGVVQLTGGDIPFSEEYQNVTVLDFCDFALEEFQNIQTDLGSKQDAPALAGSPGDVLSLDADQNPVWSTPAAPTSDYNDLQNKPQINGVTVSGNKTGADFGLLNAALARMLYAPIITDTASGDPASFPDGIADMPMKVLASIEPVQDLHGYANPWPAGGGKNLIPTAGLSLGAPSDTSYVNTTQREFTIGDYIIGLSYNNYYNTSNVHSYSISDNYIFINAYSSAYGVSIPLNNLIIGEIYTISAITTGRVGLSFYKSDGTFISGATGNLGEAYTATVPADTFYSLAVFRASDDDVDTSFTDIQLEKNSTATTFNPYSNICPITGHAGMTLYKSGSDTSNPDMYLFAWGDISGTVYGGTVTIHQDGTVKLVVDSAKKNIPLTNFTYNSVIQCMLCYSAYNLLSDAKEPSSNNVAMNAIANNITINSASNINGGANGFGISTTKDIYLRSNELTTKSGYEALFPDGIDIVYELATPIVYDLSSIEQIKSLFGDNNVWTDVGPVSVDYYADTKLFILKVI